MALLGELDLRSLAAFRIGLGTLVLVDLGVRASSMQAHYTDAGWLPRAVLRAHAQLSGQLSLHALSGSVGWQACLFAVAFAAAVAMILGLRTGTATLVSWLLHVSLMSRNPIVADGGDVLIGLQLLWAMFLPVGARWSVDALRHEPPRIGAIRSIATDALTAQIVWMYLSSLVWKTGPSWRIHFDALERALRLRHAAAPWAGALLDYPAALRAATIGALAVEAVAPLLLLASWHRPRLRLLAAGAGISLHAGIVVAMDLGTFGWICSLAWVPFLPAAFWDRVERVAQRVARVARGAPAWLSRLGAAATPFGVTPAGQRICAVVAGFAAVCAALGVMPANPVGRALRPLQSATWVLETFAMFSPDPPRYDHWFVFAANTAGGAEIDVLRNGGPVVWQRPEKTDEYATPREHAFFWALGMRASDPAWPKLIEPIAERSCRLWNAAHTGSDRIERVAVHLVRAEKNKEPETMTVGPLPCP